MFDTEQQVTNEAILVARQLHPGDGARKLARVLVPSLDERGIVRLASRVGRLLRKHKVQRADLAEPPALGPPPQTDSVASPADSARAQLERDVADLRAMIREMRSGRVFGPIPPTMKLIRELEEQVTALRRAEEETATSDMDENFMVEQLKAIPRRILERALRETDL